MWPCRVFSESLCTSTSKSCHPDMLKSMLLFYKLGTMVIKLIRIVSLSAGLIRDIQHYITTVKQKEDRLTRLGSRGWGQVGEHCGSRGKELAEPERGIPGVQDSGHRIYSCPSSLQGLGFLVSEGTSGGLPSTDTSLLKIRWGLHICWIYLPLV